MTIALEKYGGTPHWQLTVRRLGEDERGTWLGHPAGGSARKRDEAPIRFGHTRRTWLARVG